MCSVAIARFRDTEYSVVEGDAVFSVVIERVGSDNEMITLSVRLVSESAISKQLLYYYYTIVHII